MFRRGPLDPNVLAFRRYVRKVRNLFIVAATVAVVLVFMGVPSFYNEPPKPLAAKLYPERYPLPRTKTEIYYWNPICGRKAVPIEDIPEIPYIAWLPLRDCMDLSAYRSPLSEFVLGKELFDGP